MAQSDTALLEHAQNGDQRAFSELVQRHQPTVYHSCYRILGNVEDAQDASQETFLRAYIKLDTFQGRSTFKTWLVRVAINVGLNQRTSILKHAHTNIDLTPITSSTDAPESELIRSEAATRVHEALQLLRADHRAAIVLRDLEGSTYREIAENLEITEGTARSWIHRGRKRLKRILIAP